MSRHVKRLLLLMTALMLAGGALSPAGAVDNNNTGDLILGSGSDTTYNMMVQLDQLFNASAGCRTEALPGQPQPLNFACLGPGNTGIATENVEHDVGVSYFPLGSSNGIRQLCEQGLANVANISYARSSRTQRTTDCAGLRFVGYAKDAIPWVSFPNVPGSKSAGVTNLTQDQLRRIFRTCEITNWSQVGGQDGPIVVYAAQTGSGTGPSFDSFLGGSTGASHSCIPAPLKDGNAANGERVIFENNAAPIVANGDAANAIFYYSFGRFAQSGGEGSVLGSIDGVAPTPATILDGTFPFSRFVFNVYRNNAPSNNATGATRAYVSERDGYICKPDTEHSVDPQTRVNYGREVTQTISNEGFVPLPLGNIGGGVTGQSKCRVP